MFFGFRAPLCWRCLSLSISVVAMESVMGPTRESYWPNVVLGAILVMVGLIDGYRSYFTKAKTTNLNRVVYGAVLGIGLYIVSGPLV